MYPAKFCRAIVEATDMWQRQAMQNAAMPLMGFERRDLIDPEEEASIATSASGAASGAIYWDDLEYMAIDPAMARKARMEEIEVFKERQVYDIVPRSSVVAGSKLIGVRWVETDKSQPGQPPKVRSRLVCQEFARGNAPDEMCAPTPPLVATRRLLSEVASRGRGRR